MNTETVTTYLNLKSLNVTLEQLYNSEKQINVHFADSPYIYNLVLVGRDGEPDFMLSSFTGNYYCRSNKGMNRQKYTSIKGIEKAVRRLANKNINAEGEISFSLSDEVFWF